MSKLMPWESNAVSLKGRLLAWLETHGLNGIYPPWMLVFKPCSSAGVPVLEGRGTFRRWSLAGGSVSLPWGFRAQSHFLSLLCFLLQRQCEQLPHSPKETSGQQRTVSLYKSWAHSSTVFLKLLLASYLFASTIKVNDVGQGENL